MVHSTIPLSASPIVLEKSGDVLWMFGDPQPQIGTSKITCLGITHLWRNVVAAYKIETYVAAFPLVI